jgi:hypothetical protein
MRIRILATLVLVMACAAKQKGGDAPGDTHVNGGAGAGNTTGDPSTTTQPADVTTPTEPPKPSAPVTFVFTNTAAEPLTFALDKGWGTQLFAYTGTPPKARTIFMFPKAGTGACDAPTPEEVCPEQPKGKIDPRQAQADEKAETNRQVVEPSGEFALEWDGQVLVYEKAPKEMRGRNKRCECYRKAAPEAAAYTVKACGLRTASTVGKASKIECIEGQMDLPVAAGQGIRVELGFDGKAAK